MAPPVSRQLVAKVLHVTKTTAVVGAAVILVNVMHPNIKQALPVQLAWKLANIIQHLGHIVQGMKAFLPLKRWRLRKVPGPVYKPVLGNTLGFVLADSSEFVTSLCVKYKDYPVFKLWLCSTPLLVVTDSKLAKELLNRVKTRSQTTDVVWAQEADRRFWEGVLLFINGDKWARGRRAIEGSVMQASALNAHAPSMQASVDRLLEVLDKCAATGKPVNVKDCCMAMTLDIIVKAIFGIDLHGDGLVHSQASPDAVLGSAMAALAAGAKADTSLLTPEQIEYGWWDKYPVGSPEFGKRFVSSAVNMFTTLWRRTPVAQLLMYPFPGLAPVWRFLARFLPYKKAKALLKMMRGVRYGCIKLIDDWKARQQVASADTETRQQGLLGSMLAQSSVEHTVDEVISVVFTGLIAGYDTTGSTLSMCLYYLSRHPEVQRQAQQEVDSVLGGKVPDHKLVKDLPFLDAVIKESLRLASPASFTARALTTEYSSPGGALRIPAKCAVLLPLQAYHRDPSIWPRPLEFLPERFLPGHDDVAPTDPDMFFPFGAGARRCPGMPFAMLELRLALARILQRFEFRPAPGAPEPVMCTNIVYAPDKVVVATVRRACMTAVYG